MITRIKEMWLRALRGQHYKQTHETLHDEHGHCCLGVLCDLHAKETGTEWDGNYYLKDDDFLPNEVRDWAGLKDNRVTISNSEYDDLAEANDKGRSFKQIANMIEKKL